MEYIKNTDYDYIMNKYHDQTKVIDSFDSSHRGAKIFNRFIRHDDIFDESTGMDGEDIIDGIRQQDAQLQALPHAVRKAKAFEYVLKNTRISCDKRDLFPAINMVDRPLTKTVISQWEQEVFHGIIPEVEKKRAWLEDTGIVTIWPDYDHSVPIWERLLGLGFPGILRESEEARAAIKDITRSQTAFFDGIQITYTAILQLLHRLEVQAVKQENAPLASALARLQVGAPQSFYEALLLSYLYFILCEHVEGLQVRSLSNFDRVFYDLYRADLEKGICEEQIRTELAYYFLQFVAIGNYWGQPVFLGGCKADESTQINELSYIFLDVYDKMGIYNPKVQIKLADSTPKEFVLKALDMIRRGHSSIVLVSDATVRKALERAGFTAEQARLCDIKGCYEYAIQGAYPSVSMCYVNLLKPLEFALHEGHDGVNGDFGGLACPNAEAYGSFEEFYTEYKRQLAFLIEQVIDISNSFDKYLSYISPQGMLSATIEDCLRKGKDAMGGGATFTGSEMLFGFMADIADSLTNIKKYVFDRKQLTLPQLRDILDRDFEGHELLRRQLLADRDKYGNNKELPDGFAKDLADFICSKVCGKPNSPELGGKWTPGFHVARMSYSYAPYTASSPNGRLKGEELSKNLSASMGMNRESATAAILSITKIDATAFTSDACLDLGLLPSAVQGEDGLMAMYGLVMTFIKRGGHAMHINVFNADTLRQAQKHPEKYQDLQIRVCGWNALWNNINKEEQDGFIRQAEALI